MDGCNSSCVCSRWFDLSMCVIPIFESMCTRVCMCVSVQVQWAALYHRHLSGRLHVWEVLLSKPHGFGQQSGRRRLPVGELFFFPSSFIKEFYLKVHQFLFLNEKITVGTRWPATSWTLLPLFKWCYTLFTSVATSFSWEKVSHSDLSSLTFFPRYWFWH